MGGTRVQSADAAPPGADYLVVTLIFPVFFWAASYARRLCRPSMPAFGAGFGQQRPGQYGTRLSLNTAPAAALMQVKSHLILLSYPPKVLGPALARDRVETASLSLP